MENVVERESDKPVMSVKRAVKPASDARVEQAADFLKQLRRARPRDIVQIAADNRRRVRFVYHSPDE